MQKRPSSMPINIERPQSALLRGIRITEFKDNVINPDPIVLQETDFLLEEFLSPTKLKALTGVDDLYSVDNLEMVVDTSETSLGNFGIYLPNLKQLKLNSSFVPRIRDLGTSLGHLKVLWLARSGLSDLDGIPALNNLQELYLAYNEIQDLSPCSMLENLKILDLEGNLVEDIRQCEFLSLCSNLTSLTLEGNPICLRPNVETQPNSKYNYRREITKMLPNLRSLDDDLVERKSEKVKSEASSKREPEADNKFSQPCPFDDDWQLINKCLEEGVGPPEEKLAINACHRPGSSSSHGNSPVPNLRPLSAMRPLSSCRPGSAIQKRPMSGNRLSTANSAANVQRPHSDPVNDFFNDASELTIGPTLYGNPLRGLMARRKNKPGTADSADGRPPKSSTESRRRDQFKREPTDEKAENDSELYKELNDWKKEHERKLEERKKYFEPQVLRIDDYAEPVLSDQDDEIEDDNDYEVEDEFNRYASKPRPISRNNQRTDDEEEAEERYERSRKSEKSAKSSKTKHNTYDEYVNNRLNSATSIISQSETSSTASSSRVPTGDTGYASTSDVSLSSLQSVSSSSKLNFLSKASPHQQQAAASPSLQMRHQPVIVSSNSSSSQTPANKSGSPAGATSKTTSSLKQLKNNLTPLSGFKFVKN